MSFIHLSTVQPTLGQRENTEREPAMFRNDFKNGIEIKKGDQIELVNLRLNFENITITSGINDTLVWQIGPSPAFTQHVVILEEGEYTQDSFVTELQSALNKSIVLESMKPQKDAMNSPVTPTLPGGFNVLFSAANTAANPPQPFDTYTISMNQQIGPGTDDTLNTTANATPNTQEWNDLGTRVAPVAWTGQSEMANITAGNMIDDDPKKPQPSTLTSETMEKIIADQNDIGERADFNGLQRAGLLNEWDHDLLSSIQVLGYEDSIAEGGRTIYPGDVVVNGIKPAEITGIFDKKGRTTLRICPILGFSTADFTAAAASFAVPTVLTFAAGEVHDGTIALTAGANYDFSFTVTAGSSLINPEDGSLKADGTPRTGVSVIYGKFSDTIGDITVLNQYNGALRFAAGKGDDGTGGEPDADPNTDPDSVNLKSELWGTDEDNSFFYLDAREGKFKAFKFSTTFGEYFRVPWNAVGVGDATTLTPEMSAAVVGGVSPSYNVTPTKVLGWPAARLGLNRRARVVDGTYTKNITQDPYDAGPVVDARGNHEWAEYWIGICKETDSVAPVEVGGTTEPIIQVCCPQPIGGRAQYPDPDFLGSEIVYQNYLKDVTGAATDPTKDIILEIKLTDFNHIKMAVGQDVSQDFERRSTVVPVSYAGGEPSQLAPTTGFTDVADSKSANVGPPYTLPIKINNVLKEFNFPYIPMAQLSRGGNYQAQNTTDQTVMAQRGYAAMYSFDGAIGNGDIPSIINQRIVSEPDISLDKVFPDQAVTLDPGTAYELPAFWKFGRLLPNANLVGPDYDPASGLPYTEDVIEFWENYASPQSAQTIRDFQLEPNIGNLDELLGMRNLVSNIAVKVDSSTVKSSNSPNTIPISEVFNVELLSEPVKSHNGATNDIGKSIHTVLANNVKIDTDNRSLSYTPPIRLPVDLNIKEDKTVYSLTVAIRDLNNKLIPGLKAPSDVTLYKSESELSKLEKQTELIRAAIIGKNNDRNDVKVSNIGRENPLLGVIPK